jgi:hypothetical protein
MTANMAAYFLDGRVRLGRPGDVHTSAEEHLGIGSEDQRMATNTSTSRARPASYDGDFVVYKPVHLHRGATRSRPAWLGGDRDGCGECRDQASGGSRSAGSDTANVQSTVVSNANLYATASAGLAHSTIVKNDQIKGAVTLDGGRRRRRRRIGGA